MTPVHPADPPPVDPHSKEDEQALAQTSYVPVFRAYVELAESRSGPERVAVLERLYHDGVDDGTRTTEEALDRARAEAGEAMAYDRADRTATPVRAQVDGVEARTRSGRPPRARDCPP